MNVNRKQLLDELFSLRRFGIKPGLERTFALCEALGQPQRKFSSVHVAGTNGKGGVSSLIASALSEAGYTVGLYTSPHILDFRERIRVGGEPIPDADLLSLARELMPVARSLGATFFEATTALAFGHFANKGVEVAVLEAGLGGRWDSTNILDRDTTLLSVVTSVDYDHEEYLGSTLEAIASEKAGIFKPETPALIAEPRASLRPLFERVVEQAGARAFFLDDEYSAQTIEYRHDFSMEVELAYRGESPLRANLPIAGAHQTRNALTAFAALRVICGERPVSDDNIRAGAARLRHNTGLRGRIELLRGEPPTLLDVAHNPAGIQALVETLAHCGHAGKRWNVLFSAMRDKNIPAMLRALAPVTRSLQAVPLAEERAALPEEITREAERHGIRATPVADARLALAEAFGEQTDSPTLIVGSFYLAEETLRFLENARH